MAEGQISLNDQSFIPLADIEEVVQGDANEMNAQENLNLSSDMLIEEMVTNTDTAEESKSNETNEKDAATASEDRTTESPSTRETYTYKCVFCDRTLSSTDEPKLLECLHNACGSCVNNKLYEQASNENKGVECPTCNLICEADKIIDNQFLLEINTNDEASAKPAELKCSSCSDDIVATSWCVDCAEYICDICVQAHQRLKITKDHTIKPKEEGVQENQSLSNSLGSTTLFCTTHPHEKLSLFCEHCDKLTCRDCQLTEHREHKYKFTHEIALDSRKFIASMLVDISYKRVLLTSAMKVISDRQTLITEKKKALVNEITQLVVKLTNTINVRGKQLVTKLTEVCDSKQKTLHEKKIALDQLSKMTDHCIQFTQHALDNGSDMALLYSKKQVTNHLQRIKCKRADIPNPEIPVRIHLALDKVPELIKVISTIGQIVVDGRVYPSQPSSPSTSMTPQSSPSPGHQQQPPLNVLHQQLQQTPQHLQQPQQQNPPSLMPHPSHQQQQQSPQTAQLAVLPGYQQQQQQQQQVQQQHQQSQQQHQQTQQQQQQQHQQHQHPQAHHHHQQSQQQQLQQQQPQQRQSPHVQQAHPQQPHPQQSLAQQPHASQSHPHPRMLPPYGQQYNQNLGLSLNQNTQPTLDLTVAQMLDLETALPDELVGGRPVGPKRKCDHIFMMEPLRELVQICAGCYIKNRRIMPHDAAMNRATLVKSCCGDCKGKPAFCMPCFYEYHQL